MCVSQQSELKWILVGLWVLAACAGRSTRSKRSQQTLRLSHLVNFARKQGKQGDFLDRRPRVPGICQPGAPDPLGVPPVCFQCARGGCAFYFRNRGAPTTPNCSQLGFRVHPPTPLKGGPETPGPLDLPAAPYTYQTRQKSKMPSMVVGLGSSLKRTNVRIVRRSRVISVPVYREALPSLTVLTGCSAVGLGRSLNRLCKWSAALSDEDSKVA